jgi:succinate dehydrogenase/fumarate reductase flavoprotein subunit
MSSVGTGIDLALSARAALRRLDHQWLRPTGLPDPAAPGGARGLEVVQPRAIWLNRDGIRFVDETAAPHAALAAALRQPGGTFWAIFDADGAGAFGIAEPGWTPGRVAREILGRPSLVARADGLVALARTVGLPAARLEGAVAAHNLAPAAFDIARPPFYAVQLYPLARTSLGGVAVDERGRVLRADGEPIEGLYAAGEVTGFAGIAGRSPIDGSLAGASIYMGRVAGRAAAESLAGPGTARATPRPVAPPAARFADGACTGCHPIDALGLDRPGWMHLAAAHRQVRAGGMACATCHPELHPYRREGHRLDPLVEADSCRRCHRR